MKLHSWVALGSVSVALIVPSTANASCAMPSYGGLVLTTRTTVLPADGGILVGWTYDQKATPSPSGDASDQPTWRAIASKKNVKAKTKIKLTRVALAPGLSVYQPAAAAGTLTLRTAKGNVLGTFSQDATAAKNTMPAPGLTTISLSSTPTFRNSSQHVLAAIATAPPPEAVAVIVYAVGAKTAPLALSFVRLPDTHDKLLSLEVFEDAGHCGILQPGTRSPLNKEKVALAWVDAFGRVSPLSAPVAAVAAPASTTPSAP
jgi:hypothetical protein